MDLTPDIKLPLVELNQRTRERAVAVLTKAGVDSLDDVGGAFWADILFVTARERATLTNDELEALGKASVGLGYGATQYALLSDAANPRNAEKLDAYVQALGADTLVFLEAQTAEHFEMFLARQAFTNCVVVTDFFASLLDVDDQQERKKVAWQELQAARRSPAMR